MITWKNLTKDDIVSTIYGLCVIPKSQEELVKIIYQKDSENVDKTYITNAWTELINADFATEINSSTTVKLKSSYKPFFLYCNNNIIKISDTSSEENYSKLNKNDEEIFKLIFDSKWFRNIFTEEKMIDTKPVDVFHEKRLERNIVYNPLNKMGEVIENIGVITEVLSNTAGMKNLLPLEKDLTKIKNFDTFANNWIEQINVKYEEINKSVDKVFVFSVVDIENYASKINFLKYMIKNKYFLCIPYELSEKIAHVEKIQPTYTAHLKSGIMSIRSGKKIPKKIMKKFKEK